MSIERDILDLQHRLAILEAGDRAGTWLGFVPVGSIQPISATGTYFYAGLPRATATPRRLRVSVFVILSNSAANYWTIEARNVSGITVASVTTGGGAPIAHSVWTLLEDTTMAIDPLTTTSDKILQIVATKTGSPGNLSLIPMFYVL